MFENRILIEYQSERNDYINATDNSRKLHQYVGQHTL